MKPLIISSAYYVRLIIMVLYFRKCVFFDSEWCGEGVFGILIWYFCLHGFDFRKHFPGTIEGT